MVFSVVRVDYDISSAFSLIIDVPAFLIGILFLTGWFKKKK